MSLQNATLAQKDQPVELMAHPGYPSDPGIGGLPVPDAFSLSSDRLLELELLKNLPSQFEIYIPNFSFDFETTLAMVQEADQAFMPCKVSIIVHQDIAVNLEEKTARVDKFVPNLVTTLV